MGKPLGALTYLDDFRDGWGALIPRFQRQYGLNLRVLLREWPWQDVTALILDLRSSWTETDENTACLYDLANYWLELEYVKSTTSPEDAKRAAAEQKRSRKQPPPFPIIRPVAHRPEREHAAAMRRYEQLLEKYDSTSPPKSDGDDRAAFIKAMMASLGQPQHI